jgi:hypothetical protein
MIFVYVLFFAALVVVVGVVGGALAGGLLGRVR